jgi:AcrR family transcriptional regulator
MARWQPDARERLERAAFELFVEQSFAATTVPQIAARAGLSTRTFFRHFADKRDALFADEHAVPAQAARIIAEAPASLSPLQIVTGGFDAVAEAQFSREKSYYIARHQIIQSDSGLGERQLRTQAALVEALRSGFVQRGSDPVDALLAAHITATVFGVAIGRWLAAETTEPLAALLRDTFDRMVRTATS